jgi:tRNA threonylcarbamoyladenosine biosynthesis protein TsaE
MSNQYTKEVEISTLEELAQLSKSLLAELKPPCLILLRGSLGSGKTAFTKKLLAQCGIAENKVKSPTFSLINLFPTPNYFFAHLDLYRLDKPDQFILEEIRELLDHPQAVVLIEWPEKLFSSEKHYWPETFPKVQQIIEIDLTFQHKNFRKISICVKNFIKHPEQ